MFCRTCGTKLSDNALFCPSCGTKVREEALNTQPVQPADQAAPAQPAAEPVESVMPEQNAQAIEPTVVVTPEPTPQAEAAPQAETGQYSYVQSDAPAQPEQPAAYQTDASYAPDGPATYYAAPGTDPAAQSAPQKKKKLPLILGICLAAVVLLLAILIPVLVHNSRQTKYNEGIALLENGQYAEAEAVFANLGRFEDSKDMLSYAQDGAKYRDALALMESGNFADAETMFAGISGFADADAYADECKKAQSYEKGLQLYDSGDYQGALDAFDAAGDYSNARSQADQAQKALNYAEGEELFAAGEYAGAADAFSAAGSFKDAQDRAAESKAYGDYELSVQLMEDGDYESAAALLEGLDSEMFPDRDNLLFESQSMPVYLDAVAAMEEGRLYDAYKGFNTLGNFRDSSERRAQCVTEKPKTGELYHNDDYKGSAVTLVVKAPSDGKSNYFKIYTSNGSSLVSVAFLNSNESVKIKLPAGDYMLKIAFSSSPWFGEEVMFGDEGTYQRLSVGGTDVFSFKKNYTYTLSLRSGNTSGDSVGTSGEDRDNF